MRWRIWLAQAPALAGLVVLWLIGVRELDHLGPGIARILEENYRSVVAAERMKEALERVDSSVLFSLLQDDARAEAQAAQWEPVFERELKVEAENITEEGEREAVAKLDGAWRRYLRARDDARGLPIAERQDAYFTQLLPAFDDVRQSAQVVLELNQAAMLRKREAAEEEARRARTEIAVFGLVALVLAVLAGGEINRRITARLQALAEGARRVGQGELERALPVEGRDELAVLGEEFNRMTRALRAYRRSARGELVQAQQASQSAIESFLDPVVVYSVRGQRQMANRAARALELEEPSLAGAIAAARRHVVEGRGPWLPADFSSAVEADGKAFLPRATPILDTEGGDLVGVTVVLQEVTRLRRLDQLKSDLVHTVAHELRTPLTSLGMAVHLAQDRRVVGEISDQQAELLHAAREDVARLRTLVDDLLDLSRLQEGALVLHRAPVALSALLGQSEEDSYAAATAAGVRIVRGSAPEITLSVDRERLRVLLNNLLSNAIRFTPAGGEVRLSAAEAPSGLEIWVEDDGPGIPAAQREAVFEKFWRAPGQASPGSGLGLSIARELAEAHGGALTAEAAPSGGARLRLSLPASPPASPPASSPASPPASSPGAALPDHPTSQT